MRLRAALAADPGVRDQLVMAHVDLVKILAHRLRRRLPSQVELSELVSVGVLGLIDAASRYDSALGVPFDAFARRRIHGAMLDALRGLDSVPRSVRRLQRRAEDAIVRLRQRLGHEPEIEDIAADLGITIDEYGRMLDDLRTTEVAVARASGDDAFGQSLIDLAIDTEQGPYVQLERRELKQHLAEALTQLPDRERQILALSYIEELTLSEIGRVFGVGESRVSQLRTQAIVRLRSLMRPALSPVEAH
jgi:RNA polymerase sigma factor for flagellar operon FliA